MDSVRVRRDAPGDRPQGRVVHSVTQAGADVERLPNLIIAGVGKAGTTSLFWYLSQHPGICPSDVKEIQYFTPLSEGDGILPPLAVYARHFAACTDQPYRLEASPQYFHGGRPIVDAMRETLERPRVIVMFRDPLERLWSQFRFMCSRMADLPEGITFEEYVARCREVRDRREPFSQENRLYWTIQGGFYGEYLAPWTDAFAEDLRVVFFEDLASAPERATRETCAWLGLDTASTETISYSVENRTIRYRSKTLQRLALAANKEGRLGSRRRLKEPLRRLYFAMNRRPERERMASDTRRTLQELFAPGNAALASQLRSMGYTDLPGWLADAATAAPATGPN
jgi:Sulfotransferase domain